MTFVPVPGIGTPSYEQGKNLAHWIDQKFLPGQKFEGTLLSIGMNAITIYLVSAVFRIQKQADRFVGGDFASALGPWAAFVKSLVALALILAIARFLYRRKIFLRL